MKPNLSLLLLCLLPTAVLADDAVNAILHKNSAPVVKFEASPIPNSPKLQRAFVKPVATPPANPNPTTPKTDPSPRWLDSHQRDSDGQAPCSTTTTSRPDGSLNVRYEYELAPGTYSFRLTDFDNVLVKPVRGTPSGTTVEVLPLTSEGLPKHVTVAPASHASDTVFAISDGTYVTSSRRFLLVVWKGTHCQPESAGGGSETGGTSTVHSNGIVRQTR